MERQPLVRDQGPNMYGSENPNFTASPEYGGAAAPHPGGFPSAPPADVMDKVAGYEGTVTGGGGGGSVPPPPSLVAGPENNPVPRQTQWNIPSISEDRARTALLKYAKSKCCYSTAPAENLIFRNLTPFNTFRYRLETFTESRSTEWADEPYTGQFVDSVAFGPAPLPWDIAVQVPPMFADTKKKVPVPHTASVKGCHACTAMGKIACQKCVATGRVQCWVCKGTGYSMNDQRCHHCHGQRLVGCNECSGRGTKKCSTCDGKGQLLYYIQLVITWKTHRFEYVVDQRSGFPNDRLKKVTGTNLFEDQQYMVYPVVTFPDPSINEASQRGIREHHAQFASTLRILQQKQTIELIPVTQVHYDWKGGQYSYFVYGEEDQVYTEDYPAKCCCCTII